MPNKASEWLRGKRAERPRFKHFAYVNYQGGITFSLWFLLFHRRVDAPRAMELFRWGLDQLDEIPEGRSAVVYRLPKAQATDAP